MITECGENSGKKGGFSNNGYEPIMVMILVTVTTMMMIIIPSINSLATASRLSEFLSRPSSNTRRLPPNKTTWNAQRRDQNPRDSNKIPSTPAECHRTTKDTLRNPQKASTSVFAKNHCLFSRFSTCLNFEQPTNASDGILNPTKLLNNSNLTQELTPKRHREHKKC